jgi:hypothetical protein
MKVPTSTPDSKRPALETMFSFIKKYESNEAERKVLLLNFSFLNIHRYVVAGRKGTRKKHEHAAHHEIQQIFLGFGFGGFGFRLRVI